MGLFSKLKKFVGFSGVKVEFTKVESPFTLTDSVIKSQYVVNAADDVTILSVTHTFYAKRTIGSGEDATEEEIIIVEEEQDGRYDGDESFPVALGAGESFEHGMCLIRVDVGEKLAKWGVTDGYSANMQGAKFFLKVEVDIKETAFAFDPEAEAEIVPQ